MDRLQRDHHPVRQHLATDNIHHCDETDEASGLGKVARVHRQHLVGTGNGQVAQQVREDVVTGRAFAGAGPRRQCFDAHAQHECSDVAPSIMYALTRQLVATCAHP